MMDRDAIIQTLNNWIAAGWGKTPMVEGFPEMPDGDMFTAEELLSALTDNNHKKNEGAN